MFFYNGLNLKTNYLKKIYSYFDLKFIAKKESDIKLIFSDKDLKFNDSIISKVIKNRNFSDDLKFWRKAKLLYKNSIIDIKYKFHGTSIFQLQKRI